MKTLEADPVLVGLRTRIAQHQQVVAALEATLEAYVRATEALATPVAIEAPTSTPTPVQRTPARARRSAPTPATVRAPSVRSPTAGADVEQQILTALPADRAWLRTERLFATVSASHYQTREACWRLASRGQIQREGTGRGARVRLMVDGPAAADSSPAEARPPAPAPAPHPTRSGGEELKLVGEINRVLASGASYDLRELRRNVLAACPTATVETIREAIERMVAGGTVDRIVGGESPRYRKLARRRELSA